MTFHSESSTEDIHRLVFAAAPNSCALVSVSMPPNPFSPSFAPDDLVSDALLLRCSALGMKCFSLKNAFDDSPIEPGTDEAFPVSDETIVQFLFGNPHNKGERNLELSCVPVTPHLFKRLVQVITLSHMLPATAICRPAQHPRSPTT